MTSLVKAGPLPRYYQLMEIVREQIRTGAWQPGAAIPSERELCEQHGISRMTARQAIIELVHDGLLYREQGRGTFVAKPRIAQHLLSLTGFTQDMQAREVRPGAQVLTAEMWPADDTTADRLRIKPGQPVYRLRRLRLADAEPLAVETSVVSFLGCERLLDDDLAKASLYHLLESKYDLSLGEAEQEVEAHSAHGDHAKLLGLPEGAPVLRTRRLTYDKRRQPIEYATSVYRGDKYTFYTHLRRYGHPS